MKETVENNPGVYWTLGVSFLFWALVITGFIALVSLGRITIPRPTLEIIEASASKKNLLIAHRSGEPVRFANTRCIWTPDITFPKVTEEAGPLTMAGEEIKQGRVSKLEPGETAIMEKAVDMQEGGVGKLLIVDLMSGREIFSQTAKIGK